jgi:genome maintenance exonuclease 1
MTKKFNFKELDNSVLPNTKGKRVDGFRFYDIDGKAYPSVTSVLSINKGPELEKWRQSVGEKVADWEMGRAARRGTATHTLIEEYMKGQTPSIRGVTPLGLFRLIRPYLDRIDNIRCLETIMYSKELGIAGQTDCIAEYDGKLSVIDFKTANKQRQESWIENYFVQCTAYGEMYKELFKEEVEQVVVLIASEDGSAQQFIKNTKDYKQTLINNIKDFHTYFENEVKKKIDK